MGILILIIKESIINFDGWSFLCGIYPIIDLNYGFCIGFVVQIGFQQIGNELSISFEAKLSFLETRYHKMAHILVGMEVIKGLSMMMDIRRGVGVFCLNLTMKGYLVLQLLEYVEEFVS